MFDKSFAEKGKIRLKGCKHPETAIRDAKFDGDRPIAFQGVCCTCGKVSGWGKVKRSGAFVLVF